MEVTALDIATKIMHLVMYLDVRKSFLMVSHKQSQLCYHAAEDHNSMSIINRVLSLTQYMQTGDTREAVRLITPLSGVENCSANTYEN